MKPRLQHYLLTGIFLPLLSGTALLASPQKCAHTGRAHRTLAPRVRNVAFTLCREHFAPGSKSLAAVQAVLKELNSVQESTLVFSIAGHADHREYHDALKRDGVFRLDVVKPEATRSGDARFAGRTLTRTGRGGIVEFDIVFNRRTRWNFGTPRSWAMKESPGSFRNVLLHEIGHGLGFSHCHKETPDLSVMGGRCGKWIGMRHAGLKAWDHGHIRHHYGRSSNTGKPDLILGNYRTRKNANGGWKTALNDGPTPSTVIRGESVTLSWTLFNTGPLATRDPYRMRVLLSRKAASETETGILVAEWTEETPVPPSSTRFLSRPIQIPSNIEPGTWHIVITIDSENQVSERIEENNTLVLHRPLQVRTQ